MLNPVLSPFNSPERIRSCMQEGAFFSYRYTHGCSAVYGDFGTAEQGVFISKCIELPVVSQGETRLEALRNAREAIEA